MAIAGQRLAAVSRAMGAGSVLNAPMQRGAAGRVVRPTPGAGAWMGRVGHPVQGRVAR
ncbi:hypothetical protein XFF6992_480022 [Xanthomonas citri pv. fuscans]|nr:hypothetical protein XFF6992_480022 [Xanthomonas citri pv. fuscans]SOO34936.1 hypothetical protein XFF6994_4870002 [Xanthomonas citri pv. fuscans]